jgi:hypothetical protein
LKIFSVKREHSKNLTFLRGFDGRKKGAGLFFRNLSALIVLAGNEGNMSLYKLSEEYSGIDH